MPTALYAASKWAASGYARMFHALYGLRTAVARIFMVYGPGHMDLRKLVPYVCLTAARGETPLPLEDTVAQAMEMKARDLAQKTHWPNIDLLGAQLDLYWAEFQVPVWRMQARSWKLWAALSERLEADGERVRRAPCLGQCERAPARFVQGCGEDDHVPADGDCVDDGAGGPELPAAEDIDTNPLPAKGSPVLEVYSESRIMYNSAAGAGGWE